MAKKRSAWGALRRKYAELVVVFTQIARPQQQRFRVVAAVAALLVTLIASDLFHRILSQLGLSRYNAALIQIVLYTLMAVFVIQLVWALYDLIWGPKGLPALPDAQVQMSALPYALGPQPTIAEARQLAALTASAQKEFHGDTMRASVVLAAVEKGAVLGLRFVDEEGRGVGFVDIYHPGREVLKSWVAGETFERDITADDFEPIEDARTRGDKTIEFFLGAIQLDIRNPVYRFQYAPLAAMAAREYFRRTLAQFDAITIYASIFSKAGRRYAKMFDFKPELAGGERGEAGGGHDIQSLTFRPSVREVNFFSATTDNVYTLVLKG